MTGRKNLAHYYSSHNADTSRSIARVRAHQRFPPPDVQGYFAG